MKYTYKEVMDKMELEGEIKKAAQNAFREGKDPSFSLADALVKVKFACAGRYDLLQFFLEMQIEAAFADDEIHPAEYQILITVATALGFSKEQLDRRLAMQEAAFHFRGAHGSYQSGVSRAEQLKKAYQILGVNEHMNGQEIKKAYRKLMSEHHPDKLAAKGLPPEMMEIANQKAQEIQSAYELVKEEKGIK